jgi:hypothetical protein
MSLTNMFAEQEKVSHILCFTKPPLSLHPRPLLRLVVCMIHHRLCSGEKSQHQSSQLRLLWSPLLSVFPSSFISDRRLELIKPFRVGLRCPSHTIQDLYKLHPLCAARSIMSFPTFDPFRSAIFLLCSSSVAAPPSQDSKICAVRNCSFSVLGLEGLILGLMKPCTG